MKKIKIKFDEYERRLLINALNEFRNKQIREGRITDPINELLLKVIKI